MKRIIIPAVIFLLVLVTGIWVLSRSNTPKNESLLTPVPTQVLPTISDSVKVNLTAKNNNHSIVLSISGIPKNESTIEYELTYLTDSNLPRGVLGKITVDGDKEIVRDDIVLGTCSSGKCVYDNGVKSVDLSLKFTTTNSSVSVFRKTYEL